ncbi:MAG TPA: alpha/beta fold hydrolase [Acetobacteraceae bacterium]|jgi:pimeloyl-ACP methyl ester carboxylesterase
MVLNAIEAGQGAPVILLHGLFGSARSLGVVQRALARRFRAIALDLRNHGASPHAAEMAYQAMAADVLETLEYLGALPAALIGHSMGGKTAMLLALTRPDAVTRLLVADIAPVPYVHDNDRIVRALLAVPLTPGLTRAAADSALVDAVPDASMRAFLLQNLAFGERPRWRIGLPEIAAAIPTLEGWDGPHGLTYAGPTLFVSGARSDYVRPDDRPAIRGVFPRARFVTLKDAGHWLHADNPKGFVAVVEAFMASGR